MFCTQCGIEIPQGNGFCGACGAPAVIPVKRVPPAPAVPPVSSRTETSLPAAPATPDGQARPWVVTALAVWQFGKAALIFIGMYGLSTYLSSVDNPPPMPTLVAVLTGLALLGGLAAAGGLGLLRLRPYGRIILLVFAWLELVLFPIGTVISIFLFRYLRKPKIKALFATTRPARPDAEAPTARSRIVMKAGLGIVLAAAMVFGALSVTHRLRDASSEGAATARLAIVILSPDGQDVQDDHNGVTERDIAEIFLMMEAGGFPAVGIRFTEQGAQKMAAFTEANIGRRMAFVIDGEVDHEHAAVIRDVTSENASISFSSMDEAKEFIGRLKK